MIEKSWDFHACCEQETELLSKLRRKATEIITQWVNLLHNLYYVVQQKQSGVESLEHSTIASLMMDAIETLDGISVLQREGAIHPAYVLIRKLMELELQIRYLLQDDCENKALAYEAAYVSNALSGGKDDGNVYKDMPKYKAYKQEADKAFPTDGSKPKYKKWYQIYDFIEQKDGSSHQKTKQMQNLQSVIENVSRSKDEQEFYNKIYGLLSRDAHGFLSRSMIKVAGDSNYIESYRCPVGTYFQVKLCENMVQGIYSAISCHYGVENNLGDQNLCTLMKTIKELEMEWKTQDDKKLGKLDDN